MLVHAFGEEYASTLQGPGPPGLILQPPVLYCNGFAETEVSKLMFPGLPPQGHTAPFGGMQTFTAAYVQHQTKTMEPSTKGMYVPLLLVVDPPRLIRL